MENAPEGLKTKKAIGRGLEGYNYKIQVSTLDCTGCGNCADICPAKNKALIMKPIDTQEAEIENWEYLVEECTHRDNLISKSTLRAANLLTIT